MSSLLNRAAGRGRLRRVALAGLAGVVSFALVGPVGTASAQEATESASATETTETTTTVTPTAPPPSDTATPPSLEKSETSESSETSSPSETSTPTETKEATPSLTPFDVSVLTDCYPDGFGQVTVFLRIPENKSVTYTVDLEGSGAMEAEFDGGVYDAFFADVAAGLHAVTVTGTDGSKVATEANLEDCREDQPRPKEQLEVSVKCADGHGIVTIQVYNPDTEESRFLTIKVDDSVLPLYEDFEFFPDVIAKIVEIAPNGTFVISLLEGPELIASKTITVDCAVPPPPTSPEPPQGGVPPQTTPVAPPAQGAAPPASGLPTTGAAVGGIAVLGAIALLMGATLVFVARRRRSTIADSSSE